MLDQCFLNVGSLTFRQTIGIPMGSNPVPFVTNLFLFIFESKWALHTKKCNLQKARKFINKFSSIDYICSKKTITFIWKGA